MQKFLSAVPHVTGSLRQSVFMFLPSNRKHVGTCVHHDEEKHSTEIKAR